MIRLTVQQRRVAEMIWDGFDYAEIAEALGITARTVVAHRENIMIRTGEKKTILALRKLSEMGVIATTTEQPIHPHLPAG